MPTDVNGRLFKAIFSLGSLKVKRYSRVWGGTTCFLAGKRDSGFRRRVSISSLDSFFFFFICFRLSLQTVEFKQSISLCSDAEGYLLVAAASAESEGGAGRQLSRGGCEVTAEAGLRFISVWYCRRQRGWHVCKGEHIT